MKNAESTSSSTELQNHRIVEVGNDLWRTPHATPLLKYGQLKQVAFVERRGIPVHSVLQPVDVPLNGNTPIYCIISIPHSFASNLIRMSPCPSPRSLMKMLNSIGDSIWPLGYAACDWPPTGLHTTDYNPLGPAVQFSVHLTVFLSNPYFIRCV